MPQHEITIPGPLLDERGQLREAGWARRHLLSYDRASIAAPARRIKEWDYYCVFGGDFGLALTVADNAYVGLVSATVISLSEGRETTMSRLLPLPMGSLGLAPHVGKSDVKIRLKKYSMDFAVLEGSRLLRVDIPDFDRGAGLRGALVLTARPLAEAIVTAIPWRKKPKLFYYNHKINCMDVEGVVQYGDARLVFHKGQAFACLDWGRGVWPYSGVWYWASASGLIDGKSFGFNLGYGFGDISAGTENAIFYEGRIHKLGLVTFQLNSRDFMESWRFVDDEGRLDLRLDPVVDRQSASSFFIYSSVQHQLFGHFSGRLTLDDGRVLEFSGLPGFAEKVKNHW